MRLCRPVKAPPPGLTAKGGLQNSSLGAAKGCGLSPRRGASAGGGRPSAQEGTRRGQLLPTQARHPMCSKVAQGAGLRTGAGADEVRVTGGASVLRATDGPPDSCRPLKLDSKFCAMVWGWILTEVCDRRREGLRATDGSNIYRAFSPPTPGARPSISVQYLIQPSPQACFVDNINIILSPF